MTSPDPTPITATPPPEAKSPAERYALLRDTGHTSLDSFLHTAGPLSALEIADVYRVELENQWREGNRLPVEDLVARLPEADPEAAVDLIFCEFLLREEFGERPEADEYAGRFPEHAKVLRDQIALHRAIEWEPRITHTNVEDPARTEEMPADRTPAPATRLDSHGGALPRPFDRYTLLEVLGKGGMGVVYLADDSRLGRKVALKVLRPDISPFAAARFGQEARLAATLAHPHLCPVFDVGGVGCIDFLTMPHLPGGSLAGRIKREGALAPAEAVRVVRQIADAMAAAHAAGIVHRDLKPANILLDDRGEPVVTDFGLARKVAGDDPRLTRTGTTVGTPAYLPPEQIGAAAESAGPAADVYGLGVILYELLTGKIPFEGTPGEVLRQVLADQPPAVHKVRPGVDPRLNAICRRAMAKEAGRRYASMREFDAALSDWEAGHRAPWRLGAVGVAAVAVCAIAGWVGSPVRPPAPPTPRVEPPVVEPPVASDPLTAGSRWVGTFRFTAKDDPRTVQLTVAERAGDTFRGEYRAEEVYAWEVEGTIRDGDVKWNLIRAVTPDAAETKAAGRAYVAGKLVGRELQVKFIDPGDGSRVTMTLTRQP